MCQEIHDFANQASRHLCNEYKHCSFDRIAQDHAYMDITLFVSNVIQNMCTFDALLTSHQLGWSIVPLQILMALILMEAAATPCHLEFVQYLTEQSLHIQWSIHTSSAVPVPAPHPVGINLEPECSGEPQQFQAPKLVILILQRLIQLLTPTLLSHRPNLRWCQRNLKQCRWRLLVQHQWNLKQCRRRFWMPPSDLQQHQRNAHWHLRRWFLVAPATVPKIYWTVSLQSMGLAWALSIWTCWCS